MKIRQGFVSNSSSSSFVIIGLELPEDEYKTEEQRQELATKLGYKEPEDFWDQDDLYFAFDSEDGAPEGKILIGCPVAVGDYSGSGLLAEYSVDLSTCVRKAERILEQLGVCVPLKIYSGSRMC